MIEFGGLCSVIDVPDIELVTALKCQKLRLLSNVLHQVVMYHIKLLSHGRFLFNKVNLFLCTGL